MADTSAMADLRGLDIDKLAKGFAEEELKLRRYVGNASTSAREIRWYQKTAGFLDSVDTTGMTSSQIANTSGKSRPVVVEPSWTRNTSYVRKYFVESPLLSSEDLRDSDVDILATCIRDLVRAVQKQVDVRIYNVLTESLSPSNIQTSVCYGTGWDDNTNGNPIGDILSAKAAIKNFSYDPEGGVLYIHPTEEKNLMTWLIGTKGGNIPQWASNKIESGTVTNLLGLNVVVSANATTDYALVFTRDAASWKSFMPMSTAVMDEPGIGKKFRCWEEGEAILTDPKAVVLLQGTAS